MRSADPRYVYRPMLDLIGHAEGTDKGRGYNETLAYGKFTGGDVDLVSMTLDQIDQLQTAMLRHPANDMNSSAIGRNQIVRTTLREIRETLGLTGSELYDEAMQDRLGCFLLGKRGIDLWLEGSITENALINALAKEWASLPTERNVGYHGGQNARVDVSEVRQALAEVRARHEARDHPPEPFEPTPGPALPEIATIEAVTRLATMTAEQLAAAAMAIAMAQAVQRGWRIEDPALASVPARPTPGIVFQPEQPKETDMNGIKSWFQSKTVMGGIVGLVGLVGPWFGLDIGAADINEAKVAFTDLMTAAGILFSIYGRVTATAKIAGGVTGKG